MSIKRYKRGGPAAWPRCWARHRWSGAANPTPGARGHFPTEQAALKCLYLATRFLDPTGIGRTRRAMRWKPALNAFEITLGDRFPAAETY